MTPALAPHTQHTDQAPDLSVVIPMYCEAKRIGKTLQSTIKWLTNYSRTSELILVDDGSTDNTIDTVKPFLTDTPQDRLLCVRLVRLKTNQGKGGAVRAGLSESVGTMALMMDADNAATIDQIERLLPEMKPGVGLVVGSRVASDSDVDAIAFRALTGLVFRLALSSLGMNIVRDTQCGFKLYSKQAIHLVRKLGDECGYVFDLEHMMLAKKAELEIIERGIAWRHIEGGQVSAISDGLKMLRASVKLKRRLNLISKDAIQTVLEELTMPASVIEAKPAQLVKN